jgi:hypothetical protein
MNATPGAVTFVRDVRVAVHRGDWSMRPVDAQLSYESNELQIERPLRTHSHTSRSRPLSATDLRSGTAQSGTDHAHWRR